MAAGNGNSNKYEEARNQRVEENKRRFQDLGILNISKTLAQISHSINNNNNNNNKKQPRQRLPKPKPENVGGGVVFEPRRSSRARKPVPSYKDDLDIQLPLSRKKPRANSSWTSYITRPLEEVRLATYEERTHALKAADKFLTCLQTGNPSFVKSMVRSHVYSCFWLGLPTQFCKDHLKENDLDMILVDENNSEYDAKYLGKRAGLSGGWRGFALDHKLDDGDALVFELVEPDRFKVYTFKVSSSFPSNEQQDADREASQGNKHGTEIKLKSKRTTKKMVTWADEHGEISEVKKAKRQGGVTDGEQVPGEINQVEKNGRVPRKPANAKRSESEIHLTSDNKKGGKSISKPKRKKCKR